MHFSSKICLIGIVTLALILACGEVAPTPMPTPTPTAQPVEGLYQFFLDEQEKNPQRLEKRADDGESFGFTGRISKIDGSVIQFVISEQSVGKDSYVECDLESSDKVLPLNIGDQVTVYGYLDKAFPTGMLKGLGFKDNKAIKFKDCRVATH